MERFEVKDVVGPQQAGKWRRRFHCRRDAECAEHRIDDLWRTGLIETDTDVVGVDVTEVDLEHCRRCHDIGSLSRYHGGHGVEPGVMGQLDAGCS